MNFTISNLKRIIDTSEPVMSALTRQRRAYMNSDSDFEFEEMDFFPDDEGLVIHAIQEGDLKKFQDIWENIGYADSQELLDQAVENNQTEIAEWLVTRIGVTPTKDNILDVANTGNLELFEIFLEDNPNLVTVQDTDGNNLLHIAAMSNMENIVNYFLEEYPEQTKQMLNQVNTIEGKTPLHHALDVRNYSMAKKLIETGAHVTIWDGTRRQAIDRIPNTERELLRIVMRDAINRGATLLIYQLITTKGIDPDFTPADGEPTFLDLAIATGNPASFEPLLRTTMHLERYTADPRLADFFRNLAARFNNDPHKAAQADDRFAYGVIQRLNAAQQQDRSRTQIRQQEQQQQQRQHNCLNLVDQFTLEEWSTENPPDLKITIYPNEMPTCYDFETTEMWLDNPCNKFAIWIANTFGEPRDPAGTGWGPSDIDIWKLPTGEFIVNKPQQPGEYTAFKVANNALIGNQYGWPGVGQLHGANGDERSLYFLYRKNPTITAEQAIADHLKQLLAERQHLRENYERSDTLDQNLRAIQEIYDQYPIKDASYDNQQQRIRPELDKNPVDDGCMQPEELPEFAI